MLKEDVKARPGEKSALARLREAAQRGPIKMSVTGRVDGWTGHFPPFLKTLPKKPREIVVRDFEEVKK